MIGGVTAMLEQQELMDPPPKRRMIVPKGHTAWWGVDPSTQRVAIAGVSRAPNGSLARWVHSTGFVPGEGLERLSWIYAQTHALALQCAERWPPGLVMVEQPGGEHRNYPLFYATGVIAAAVSAAVVETRLETVVPGAWKKTACGRGDIYKTMRVPGKSKPVPVPFEEYGVLAWARANGYRAHSWDEADAWAIAEAARRTVALEER
jgi:hypothetical protein